MSEAAGAAGIEFEDQLLPKRVHHHVGIEHAIPQDLMVAKIREAVAARRDPDFVIIGRTNQIRRGKHDDAMRRAEAYKEAGSDMMFVLAPTAEDLRFVGERLPPPLMLQSLGGGIDSIGMTSRSSMTSATVSWLIPPPPCSPCTRHCASPMRPWRAASPTRPSARATRRPSRT